MKNLKLFVFTLILIAAIAPVKSQITEIGLASFYADKFDGRVTASGETFDQNKLTAAHRTFPFGTVVKVTNKTNNKSVIVTINDRGPFVKDRVIDLSKAAAIKLGFTASGTAQVKVEVISLGKSEEAPNRYSKPAPVAPSIAKNELEPEKPAVAAPITTVKTTTTTEYSNQNTIFEYYKLESEYTTPMGFGIQIASYQDAYNLIKRCDDIRKELHKEVLIQVGESNGNKIYRIIIGPFPTREAATSFNEGLKNSFKGSFVLEF